MIPADRLAKVNHIVSHAFCPDGIASVMILKLIWPKAKVTFTNYGTEVIKTMPAEEGMIFCDFSPSTDRIEEFKAAGAIVLDHHKSAKEAVLSFGELGLFADEAAEPGVSGAVLAYRLWKQMASPEMLNSMTSTDLERFSTLVGIRDTWQKESPRWKQACELTSALLFFPPETWDGLHPSEWWDRLFVGERLFEKRLEESKACLDAGFTFTTAIFGRRVILFESLTHTSDAAEMVGDRFDIVAGFGFKAEDGVIKMWYSTRTHTDSIDVSAFCKANGGGGHSRAAGFMYVVTDETPNPYKLFQKLLALFEFSESKHTDEELAASRVGE